MNLSNLSTQLKFVNRTGQNLSTQEIISLQSSALKLSHEYKHQQYNFWGRIQGTHSNYYLIQALTFNNQHFPKKQYFWSSEDFTFAQLPAPRKEFIQPVKQLSSFFTGQHEKIIQRNGFAAPKSIQIDGEDFQVKPKSFTQLDRLSLVVHLIDQDCQVVPLGAYTMLPTHQLVLNPAFRGLKPTQAKNMSHYVHLRAPNQKEKQLLIQCDKALQRSDFLDSIDQDAIKESWSVQTDESGTQVTVRSLLWIGYVGYHRCNSRTFGGVYLGTGIMSYDLSFIL